MKRNINASGVALQRQSLGISSKYENNLTTDDKNGENQGALTSRTMKTEKNLTILDSGQRPNPRMRMVTEAAGPLKN